MFDFQKPTHWSEDLVLTELPSLEEIVENPEAWYELTTINGHSRDLYFGEDKQTMILFHGGGVFEKFDPRYWGRGEGSATTAVLVGGGKLSTSIALNQAIYYCKYPLSQGCPAAVHLILADISSIVGRTWGAEVQLAYADAENIQIVSSVGVDLDDILRVQKAYGVSTVEIERMRNKAPINYTELIVGQILPDGELEHVDIPYESLRDDVYSQVQDLVTSSVRVSAWDESVTRDIISLSEIAKSAIDRVLGLIGEYGHPEEEGSLDYILGYYSNFVEDGHWAAIMRYLFSELAEEAESMASALIRSIAAEYFYAMQVNLSLIRNFGSLEDSFAKSRALPEDPLKLKCLSPSAVITGFNRKQHTEELISLSDALASPEMDVLFPRAKAQQLRCTYWNTLDIVGSLVPLYLKQMREVSVKVMSRF